MDEANNSLPCEIRNICEEASDWQDALEKIAEGFPTLADKKIINAVMDYFFPLQRDNTEQAS